MNFTLAELTRIKLEPGEVLSVKLFGDDYEIENVEGLKKQLQSLFPNNKIIMFMLPNGNDLQMEIVSGSLEDNKSKELDKLVDTLNNDCSSPKSYCNDCSCGKKASIEGELNESQSKSRAGPSGNDGTSNDRN